jgi:Domain of unknown function (DUF4279)
MKTTDATNPQDKTFNAGASFRIQGLDLDLERISRELDQGPTYTHNQGEPDIRKHTYPHDMWYLSSPLGESQELESHLEWLAERLLPHKQYISSLRKTSKVDIYCWKNCFTEQASLILSSHALGIFTELSIPLDVSLIFLPGDPEETAESVPHQAV